METKCVKYGCQGARYKGRLCLDHYINYKASKQRYGNSIHKISPRIMNQSPTQRKVMAVLGR